MQRGDVESFHKHNIGNGEIIPEKRCLELFIKDLVIGLQILSQKLFKYSKLELSEI